MAKSNDETRKAEQFAEDWLPITDIKNGMIEIDGGMLQGKQYLTGVRVEPRNIFIADPETQFRAIEGLKNFYNTIDYEFWLISCDRPVDIDMHKRKLELMYNEAPNQQIRKLIAEDINKCDMFTGPAINAVDTEFYILFKESVKNKDLIDKRIHNLMSGLAESGLRSRQITDNDARVLLDSFFNDGKKTEFGTVMEA